MVLFVCTGAIKPVAGVSNGEVIAAEPGEIRAWLVLLLLFPLLVVGAALAMVDQGSGMLAGAAEREVSIRLKRPPPLPVAVVEDDGPASERREDVAACAARFCKKKRKAYVIYYLPLSVSTLYQKKVTLNRYSI